MNRAVAGTAGLMVGVMLMSAACASASPTASVVLHLRVGPLHLNVETALAESGNRPRGCAAWDVSAYSFGSSDVVEKLLVDRARLNQTTQTLRGLSGITAIAVNATGNLTRVPAPDAGFGAPVPLSCDAI